MSSSCSSTRSARHRSICDLRCRWSFVAFRRGRSEEMSEAYVHGYDARANERLQDQAAALVDLLQADTHYPEGSRVLEVGCGVGAQTMTLARRSPAARFTSIDVSEASLDEARQLIARANLTNVEFQQGDIFALPFGAASFDHVFVCFVLEHLARPVEALAILHRLIRPGGTITVIEGDHGSTYFHPDDEAAQAAIQCQVSLQRSAGGNALIGREVYPLLVAAGFADVRVSPRMVHVDASRPGLVDGFTRKTFTAMIEGVRDAALAAGIIDAPRFDAGVRALHRTTEADGVFLPAGGAVAASLRSASARRSFSIGVTTRPPSERSLVATTSAPPISRPVSTARLKRLV